MFVWLRNGANRTKAFVEGLLVPEMKIVEGATCSSSTEVFYFVMFKTSYKWTKDSVLSRSLSHLELSTQLYKTVNGCKNSGYNNPLTGKQMANKDMGK